MSKKEMLINVSEGEECRIALLEDGQLEELYMERTSSTSHVGNIYKGRVTNVEPSIQAAFVDFGLGRNGFLHISDLMPTYFGRQGEDIRETVGRKMARRDRPPIQRCLRRGDEIVVQIIKEGIGTKGPTLTTYLSIPGKILVMMPGVGKSGVSRKIEDEEERRRLRQILDQLKPPTDVGFIIRTAGVGSTKTEIQRDLTYLSRLWTTFKKKRDSGPGPVELYTEGDLVTRTVRDVFTSEVDKLIVDNKEVAKRVKDVIKLSNPRTRNKVELYDEPLPLFTKYGIEKEIEMMYSRHVPLPSGGSLVIDSTEAIVAIDVNSGKFRDHKDAETTAFKTDMEAADEICRQLKLRDLGGVIICDFIDLRFERHRRDLERKLHDNLKNDRAKTKVLRMSQFGIIEMTRQRMRPSLKRSVYFDCPHCKGAGLVKTHESMSLDVMRRLRIAIHDQRVHRVELAVCSDVAFYLQNKKRRQLAELEDTYKKRIIIRADQQLGLDEMRIELFDNREGMVVVEQLGMLMHMPHTTQLGTKPQQFQQRGRGGRDERGGHRQQQPQRGRQQHREREEELPEDRFERVEDEREHEEEERQPAQTEADSEAVEPSMEGAMDRDQEHGSHENGEQGGGRRRRRRRRGRRGRGRNRQQAMDQQNGQEIAHGAEDFRDPSGGESQQEAFADREPYEGPNGEPGSERESPIESEPASASRHDREVTDEPGPAPEEVKAEETSREAPEAEQETTDEPKPKTRRRGTRGGRGRKRKTSAQKAETEADATPPSRSAPAPAPEPVQVVRTGSTDRHLIEDEPVLPPPTRRPRSIRDLDSIPDDYD
ncbi:MAG TPA: Rne/Rng family ribonuclease [Tepidisphaeraceae bacterium]|nr:Rne/Rng family ribonuclease [Tepidisphaeraceae bacterium]